MRDMIRKWLCKRGFHPESGLKVEWTITVRYMDGPRVRFYCNNCSKTFWKRDAK